MKKIKIIIFLIAFFSLTLIPVQAKQLPGFYAGDNINVKEEINATAFIAGNNVEVSSDVNGSSFIAGESLQLSSKQDTLFAAGNRINVKGITTKDAFIAGNRISIEESTIRDLFVAGSTVSINSDISRNVFVGADKVVISSNINGDVYIAAEKINIKDNAVITGTLRYPDDATLDISSKASVNKTKQYKSKSIDPKMITLGIIEGKIISFLSLLLIGLLLIFVNKKLFDKIGKIKTDSNTILKTFGIGFLFLIVVPIISIILICTIIGAALSLIIIALYIIMIYLSTILTAYYLGNLLLKNSIKNKYGILSLSLLVLFLLKLVPIIGGLVAFISLCLGLGISLNLISNYTKQK